MGLWIKSVIKRLFFFGWRYQCYACKSNLRSWQWQGEDTAIHSKWRLVGSGRRLCLCPICHSIDRERLLLHYLDSELTHAQWRELRILHIAPEKVISDYIQHHQPLQYVQGDSFADGYSYDQAVNLDIQNLPFQDASFDLIICSHVLEHVPDDALALKEFRRVLAPKGKTIIMIPMAVDLPQTIEGNQDDTPATRKERYGQFDHLRLYGNDFSNRLIQQGFKMDHWQGDPSHSRWDWNKEEFIFIAQHP